jgi:transposase
MARPYDDDLRRKFLAAYDRGEGSIGELAQQFGVSEGWGWKVSAARNRTGQMERVIGRRGRPPRVTAEILRQLVEWVKARPHHTLEELRGKLLDEAGFQLSMGRLWQLLKKLGLQLKKSHSMPSSGTAKPTSSAAGSSLKASVRSRRRT